MTDMNDTEKAWEYLKTFIVPLQEASKNGMFAHEACGCLMAIKSLSESAKTKHNEGTKSAADYWAKKILSLLDDYGNYLYAQSVKEDNNGKDNN